MKPYALIRSVLLGNRSWEQFSILLARVSLGMFFAISGANKLFVTSRTRQMYETLAGAGIPFPHFMTYFVSSVEFISGCLLIIGLLSSLCCAALIIQMIVAITTVQLAGTWSETPDVAWDASSVFERKPSAPKSVYLLVM
jgi:putative oxidoreductase